MKPHLLYISSPDKESLLKLNLATFEKNGCTEYWSTIVINTPEVKDKFHPGFFKGSEIIHDDSHYKDHPTTRWFIEPKSDVCIIFDYDIITRSDVKPLVDLCHQTQSLCGVIAYCSKIERNLFQRCFEECSVDYVENCETWIDKVPVPRYYNYGVLAIPSKLLKRISEPLAANVQVVNQIGRETQDEYVLRHGGQIALAVTVEQLKVSSIELNIRYNFPNIFPEVKEQLDGEIVFEHLLNKKLTDGFLEPVKIL